MTLTKYWVLKEWLGYTIQFSSFSGRQVETVPVYEAADVDRVVEELRATVQIWTQRKPKKAGWWWYRADNYSPSIIRVFMDERDLLRGDFGVQIFLNDVCFDRYHGEWSSEPIALPKEV